MPLERPSNPNNVSGNVLTAYLCLLLAYLTWALVTGQVAEIFRDVVVGLVGFITGKLSTVFDWHYGTSSVSKKQTDTISTLANTTAAATNPTPDRTIPLAPGETAAVTAAPAAKPSTDGDAQ